jgi:hypothetical protein
MCTRQGFCLPPVPHASAPSTDSFSPGSGIGAPEPGPAEAAAGPRATGPTFQPS